MRPIHFNTAGAGLASPAVIRAMTAYLNAEFEHGAYEAERMHAEALDAVRTGLAWLLNAPSSRNVALFDSGTRAWLTCVNAIAGWRGRGKVWTTPYEYAGNLLALQMLCARHALELEVVPLLENGDLDLEWIEAHADDALCLASVVHVPSGCGIVLPVERIGRILRGASPHALYAVDACQSAGQLDTDFQRIGCDLLTAAGRKFLRGPRGTGFAIVSQRWLDRLGEHPIDLHAAEVLACDRHRLHDDSARRLELSEMHLAALMGLKVAVDEARGRDLDPARQIYAALCERLADRDDVALLHPGSVHSGIVSFVHRDRTPIEVVNHLRSHRINAWKIAGGHTPLYLGARGFDSAIRLSAHCTNAMSDIDDLERALSGWA
ncbi:aminotransferase [Burkholderia savannae]|uniref:aminotransferase class V-fold PLP-dependent enzyme n=1 Tax=Burkholderia savannae TaxID=1637837 RepID=UPI00076432D6|nr:aminotransferase class V-fold PLP-dependent enzyme [Burkholderia savannae]KWZ45211.1 aminotransferase [Burkholderia savannae]